MGYTTPALARNASEIYDLLQLAIFQVKGVKVSDLVEHTALTQGEANSFVEKCAEVIEQTNPNMKSHRRYRVRAGIGREAFIEALGGVLSGKCGRRHYTPVDKMLDGSVATQEAMHEALSKAIDARVGEMNWRLLAEMALTYLDMPTIIEAPVAISNLEEN